MISLFRFCGELELAYRCPSLTHLALTLDPNLAIPDNWIANRFPHLIELMLQHPTVDDPLGLAPFLSSISSADLCVALPDGYADWRASSDGHRWAQVTRLVSVCEGYVGRKGIVARHCLGLVGFRHFKYRFA